jgi:hypothetical protein
MRTLIDWYKRIVKLAPRPSTTADMAYVDKQWLYLVTDLALQQGVPASALHYMMGEIARTEMRVEQSEKQGYVV